MATSIDVFVFYIVALGHNIIYLLSDGHQYWCICIWHCGSGT